MLDLVPCEPLYALAVLGGLLLGCLGGMYLERWRRDWMVPRG